MLSKDAEKYLKEVQQTSKRQSVFTQIEDDIIGLRDAGLTYDQIWEYAKTKIDNMPKSKNSLVNFINIRIKKRKKLSMNKLPDSQKNNQNKPVKKTIKKDPKVQSKEDKKEEKEKLDFSGRNVMDILHSNINVHDFLEKND